VATSTISNPPALDFQNEKYWTVVELSRTLRVSPDTIRRLFELEEGVVVIGNRASRAGKRRYRTLIVPAHVLRRVLRQLSVVRQ